MADEQAKDKVVELTPEQLEADAFKQFLREVPANVAQVQFPSDRWGSLTALKKEGLKAASAVRGQPDKQKILIQTLQTILRHAQVRFNVDVEARKAEYEQNLENERKRAHLERTTGRSDDTVATVNA